MYEGFFLIALVTVVIFAMRPGKQVRYDNPVVNHKPGFYHATIAPELERAQYFIESVTGQFFESGDQSGDIPAQYFSVHDAAELYLLAAGFRAGTLYFQAIAPLAADSHYKTLKEFADQVMVDIPLAGSAAIQGGEHLRTAVEVAAKRLEIVCLSLQE